MKRINFALAAAFTLMGVAAHSQQLTASSFFDMHPVLHNPAAAGGAHRGVIGATYRTQWSSMPGSPKTAVIFGNTYLAKSNIGIGGYLYNDVTGPTTRNGLQAAFAYHIPLKEKTSFSLGVEARVQQLAFDRSKLQGSLGTDPVIMGNERRIKGDAGFGIAYNAPNFNIGASASQLVQSKLNLYEGTGNPNEEAKLYRHYYLHSNYTWEVDKVTKIIPNILFIYLPNAPLEMQAGARVEHNELFWYGLTWRARQAWMISAGLKVKKRFNFGYSFDIYRTPLSNFNMGSQGHELMLRYDFLK